MSENHIAMSICVEDLSYSGPFLYVDFSIFDTLK